MEKGINRQRPGSKRNRGVGKDLAATYFPARERAVSSARKSLTAEFGMGSGVPSSPWLPKAVDGARYRAFPALFGDRSPRVRRNRIDREWKEISKTSLTGY